MKKLLFAFLFVYLALCLLMAGSAGAGDTSWIAYSRFVVKTVRLDTLKDTFDIIPKPAPKVEPSSLERFAKMHYEIDLLTRRISELEDNFSMMLGAKDLKQMKELLRQKDGYK